MLRKIVLLQVLASDFKGNSFSDNNDCAIARAGRRRFKGWNASEAVYYLRLYKGRYMYMESKYVEVKYDHENFSGDHFDEWQAKAEGLPDDTLMFTLRLEKRA